MRLHELQIQAFQAFAGSEHVDFDTLAADGLFLLRGDTGAGKTTLLDAVCFAFYGQLPGARGNDARVRSDHADPEVRTEVVLEATLRETRVRITRVPAQERPKRRGSGLTTEAGSVLVEAIEAGGATRVLASGHDDARAELGRLLGLTREQFCQVVLLPQGEFATFLRARSEDRKELLTELFAAERFGIAEAWLTRRQKQAEADVAESTKSVSDVASRLAEVTGEEPPDGWREDPDQLTAWLAERQVVAGAQRATAEDVRAQKAQAEQEADAELQIAVALTERRMRHAQARERDAQLQAQAPIQAARAEALADARRAAVVVPLLREAALRATSADDAVADGERALVAAGSSCTDSEELRREAKHARLAIGEAQALRGLETDVAEREQLLAVVREAHRENRSAHTELEAWLADADSERAVLAEDAEATSAAAEALASLRAEDERRQAQAIAARARDSAEHERERHTHARHAARTTALAARERWLDLREARLAGMAAELARALAPGEPCAVCGALEHPAPAAPAGDAVDAAVERAAQDAHERAEGQLAEAEQRVAGASADLAQARALAGPEPVAELLARAAASSSALEDAQRLAARAGTAAQALAAHDEAAARKRSELTKLADVLTADEARVATLQAELDTGAQRLAEALGDAADVAALLAALEEQADRLEQAAHAVEHARGAVAEAQRARAAADAEAQARGFADAQEAHGAARDDADLATIERELREHDDRLAECRAALDDPELQAAADAPEPDLDALKRAKREATEAHAQADRGLDRAAAHADKLAGLEQHLTTRLAELCPLREHAQRIREVAMLADGTSSANRKRMRLSAYVLAARLEQIAAAASVRLAAMSSGRYTLVHSDEGARRNRQHGLDLRVVDGWTGHERHPATLSGGETFLASLALALGLADVVCAEAGGARLETLFVDEGFGALDEGALDEVLDVLDHLRDGGRSVGVVSHVPELRQRISAQLHVVKGRNGSHVRATSATGPRAGAPAAHMPGAPL